MTQGGASPDTPQGWGAASRGYAGGASAGGWNDERPMPVMDGQALDLDDASFDAAAASFALMLFPERIVYERYSGGPITMTNVATLGSGVAS